MPRRHIREIRPRPIEVAELTRGNSFTRNCGGWCDVMDHEHNMRACAGGADDEFGGFNHRRQRAGLGVDDVEEDPARRFHSRFFRDKVFRPLCYLWVKITVTMKREEGGTLEHFV